MVDLAPDQFGPDVGGEEDDGVAEIDHAADVVGQFAFFQDLQEHVHHVGMGLFDFVEEHHGIGAAADLFGELAAFLVADVAGRRTDHAGGVVAFHVFAHVQLDERLGVAEQNFRQRLGQKAFCRRRWGRAGRRCRWAGAGPSDPPANGARPCTRRETASFWPMIMRDISFSRASKRWASPSSMRLSGMPVHLETTCKISSSPTVTRFSSRLARQAARTAVELFLGVLFLVAHGGGAFKILVFDGPLLLAFDLLDLGLQGP